MSAPPRRGPGPGALRSDPAYVRFWCARVLAVAGAAVTAVALPLLAYDRSGGSAVVTTSVAALQVLPYLVLGLVAGALADRVPRRRVMVGAELVCVAALTTLALLGDRSTTWHVLVVATVVPTAFVWFDAAAFGALPAIVGRDRLVEANSALWTATSVVAVAGPAVGGLLVAAAGTSTTLLVDAVACLAAAVLLGGVRTPLGPDRAARAPATLAADVAEGLRFVLRTRLVRVLTLAGTLNAVAAGAVTGLVVVLVVERLDRTEDSTVTGVLLAVVGTGGLLASLALPRLAAHVRVGVLTLAALVAAVPGVLLLAATTALAPAVVALLVWSTASTLVVLNGITARQRVTPDHLQARVNTTARMLAWGGTPVGALGAGILADVRGVATALLAAALVLVGAVAYGTAAGLLDPDLAPPSPPPRSPAPPDVT